MACIAMANLVMAYVGMAYMCVLCVDMCGDVCAHMCAGVCMDMCTGVYADM